MKSKIVVLPLIIVLFVTGCFLLNETLAKFESELSGNVIGSIAFYVIDTEYQTQEIKLDEIEPSNQEYIYEFTIANFNKEKRLETNAEYNIVIRTTTNLNLEYRLLENDKKEDVFIDKNLIQDEDGLYYNVMKTDKEYFGFKNEQINKYQLRIKFPKEYSSFEYQNIIESMEIIILSKQVVE